MQGEKQYKTGLDVGSTTAKIVIIDESGQTVFSRYERHNAQVNDLLSAYFREARQELGNIETSIAVTGSVGMGTAEQLRTEFIQEVVAATRYAQQLYPSASALIDIGGEDAITLDEIITAVNKEDLLCIEIVEEIGQKLGKQIAGLINIFNPELVIIGGTLSLTGDYITQPIKTAVRKYSLNLVNKDSAIITSKLKDKAGIVGACMLARSRMFES